MNNSCSKKDTVKRMKGQDSDTEKIFVKDVSNKRTKCWQQKTTWWMNGPKTLTHPSPQKTYGWQISIWKYSQCMSSGKRKLEQHYTPTGMAKIQTLTPPSAGEDVEAQKFSLRAGRMQSGAATLEDNLLPENTRRPGQRENRVSTNSNSGSRCIRKAVSYRVLLPWPEFPGDAMR